MLLFLTKVTITVYISAKFSFVQSLCVHRHILHFNRLFDHPADKVVGYQRFWFANMSKLFWLTIHRSCETQIWGNVSCDGAYNFLRNIRKSQSPLLLLYEKEKCFWRFTRGPKNNECFATNKYMCSLYRKYSIKVINKSDKQILLIKQLKRFGMDTFMICTTELNEHFRYTIAYST